MLVSGYDLWFGKPSLHRLFEGYFDQAGRVQAGVMLKMLEDPHVDLTATVSGTIFVVIIYIFFLLVGDRCGCFLVYSCSVFRILFLNDFPGSLQG
jgi:hypothetical protein